MERTGQNNPPRIYNDHISKTKVVSQVDNKDFLNIDNMKHNKKKKFKLKKLKRDLLSDDDDLISPKMY